MLNTEHAYHEAGYKCARARLERDEARAAYWRIHFARMQAHEADPADKAEARYLFDRGYAEAQPARKPEHFR